jgi:uncharacterized MnhB-related membrane protein
MSEVTSARIVIRSIRFVAPDVAMVDCTNTQYGSMITTQVTPVLLVMKKDRAEWKIASVRLLVPPTPLLLRNSK